jgi:hypothetical protein
MSSPLHSIFRDRAAAAIRVKQESVNDSGHRCLCHGASACGAQLRIIRLLNQVTASMSDLAIYHLSEDVFWPRDVNALNVAAFFEYRVAAERRITACIHG